MKKIRGCFITLVLIIFLGALVFLCVSLPGSQLDSGSSILSPSRNLLFLGVDEQAGGDGFGGRTDTILIYHVAGWGQKDSLISIPRDIRVDLEGYGYNKINAANVFGGKEMLIKEIYELTGIRINNTMMVNFDSFKRVIDILGGVTIEITEPMHDHLSGANFDPGVYNMDGEQALAYARCRATARADLDRVERQQELLNNIFEQKMGPATVIKIPQIIKVLNEETVSDFNVLDYMSIGLIMLISSGDMNRLTIPAEGASIDGISYLIADPEQVRQYLSEYINLD